MAIADEVHDDLRFVREAVARRDAAAPSPASILYLWAVYVLLGYTMLDATPRAAGWFFLFGGVGGGIASGALGRRAALRFGEQDRHRARRMALHWGGAPVLAFLSLVGLNEVIPHFNGQAFGQLFVVMLGLIYFTAGIHLDRHFLWLGPVLMVGGVLVGLFPRYGWTGLGIVIALGLVAPTFFPRRKDRAQLSPSDAHSGSPTV